MRKGLTMGAAACLAASLAWGAAVESFDYAPGPLDGRGGGAGFAGAWKAVGTLNVVAGSPAPSATMRRGYATAGGAVESAAGGGTNEDWAATRPLAAPVDLDADATVFFSFLVEGRWSAVGLSRGFNVGFTGAAGKLTDNAVTVKKDYNTANLVCAVGGGNRGAEIAAALRSETAVFVVAKLITSATRPETLSIAAYRARLSGQETVPSQPVWSVTVELGPLTGQLTHLVVQGRVNDPGMQYRFDELRVGRSWDEVTEAARP